MTTGDLSLLEIGLTAAAFGLLAGYHLHLLYRLRTAPESTLIGLNELMRIAWVDTMVSEQLDIVAVQTLRNWTMAASFLASTAIVLSLGILNVALTTDKIAVFAHALNMFGSRDITLWIIKVVVLSLDLLYAFFNFTLAIRSNNHVVFLINVRGPGAPDRETVAKALNRGARYYTWGMRTYYLTVPLAMWILGPGWLLASALLLVLVLRRLDAPE